MDTKRKRIARLEVQAPDPEAERVQTLLAQLPTCAIRWVSELVKKANAGLELDSAETEEIEHLGKLLGGELDWECQGGDVLVVWQFVENNDFTGKNVILFNTFNSAFKQEYIDAFQEKVESKNGRFVRHLYVKRGRMTRQISPEAMLEQVRRELRSLQETGVLTQ